MQDDPNPNLNPSADVAGAAPSLEALLAGTLALMTGCAQHTGPMRQRELMVGKVVSNLSQMARWPGLSAPMQRMLSQLSNRWLLELGPQAQVRDLAPLPEHRTLQ